MNQKTSDITSISIRDAVNDQEETEYHLEAVFKNGEKYAIAVFDSECEDICNDVYNFINSQCIIQTVSDNVCPYCGHNSVLRSKTGNMCKNCNKGW